MSREQIERALKAALGRIAPEVDLASLDPEAPLREELELDSMDFLRLLVALSRDLGVDIPDRDASRLRTAGDIVRYLEAGGGEGGG